MHTSDRDDFRTLAAKKIFVVRSSTRIAPVVHRFSTGPVVVRFDLHVQWTLGGRVRCGCARIGRTDRARGGLAGVSPRLSHGRIRAGQLRRACARRRPHRLFDTDGHRAVAAAAPGESAGRARRLGPHEPLRRDGASDALLRDSGGARLRSAFERNHRDAQHGDTGGRRGRAARTGGARAQDARGMAAQPLQLSPGRGASDADAPR